jgi:hypothetical protein
MTDYEKWLEKQKKVIRREQTYYRIKGQGNRLYTYEKARFYWTFAVWFMELKAAVEKPFRPQSVCQPKKNKN